MTMRKVMDLFRLKNLFLQRRLRKIISLMMMRIVMDLLQQKNLRLRKL